MITIDQVSFGDEVLAFDRISSCHRLVPLRDIGSVPIRFLKGDPLKPSHARTVLSALEEYRHRVLQLDLDDDRRVITGPGWVWRFVVVPDEAGGVLEIFLCQMKAGHTPRYLYPIAFGPITKVTSTTALQRDATDLGKPPIELADEDEAAGEGQDGASGNGG